MSIRRRLFIIATWGALLFYGLGFAICVRDVNVDYFDTKCGRPSVLFYYSRSPATNARLDIAFWPLGRLLEVTGYWQFMPEPF